MTPKLQAMLARVEELEWYAAHVNRLGKAAVTIWTAEHLASVARAEFNRALREEGEREGNQP